MKRNRLLSAHAAVVVLLAGLGLTLAAEREPLQLPAPRKEGGRPLMEVLMDRKSTRSFSARELPAQELSNLFWAAFGVNRPESGGRTAPSAVGWKEIDIYVATARGLYLFDPDAHALKLILAEDIRALTGVQSFVAQAPVNLVYVADFSRMGRAKDSEKEFYSAADTGFIGQNVYLYCASEGLATVVRASIDRPALARRMGLREDQKIILAQTVGYPK